MTLLNARTVVAPIMSVRDALRSVESGDLDTDVLVYDGTELGLLIGDAVLAIFGAPVRHPDHAGAALAAARAMARRLSAEVPDIGAGIGVATGTVVAGNVGHTQRFEYTVIGDAVNSAARLTDLAKDVPGRVLATQDSVATANPAEAAYWHDHGATTLRGRSTETRLAAPLLDSTPVTVDSTPVEG